ncbi:ATP-binding cassette domain-containing protein [Petrotoga sp. 9PWA.NaAc.5.4]|uniref:ABC transporter ATP-binding protein n=1 Tax=Petrotoga sp. 9PWA.NaAc.5.4 TaxID=1434328 RepID=UPI000EFADFD6|nr:energy-coupling factor ABC transporter ATP-binding protein [Petrotoga sp. 9PWA.NaAc.5.4]
MIVFENVSKKFDGSYIIKNFTLKIEGGSKTLIYGKSGIGKTTIIKLILGFITPDEGQIYYNNQKLNSKNVWQLRKNTAYIGQNIDIADGTVEEIIKYILGLKVNQNIIFEKEKIIELLNFFELDENILKKDFGTLSGGEKQRVLISIFTFLNKKIYLLDEVTSSLDREMKIKVIQYFVNKKEWTVVSISHDQEWINTDRMNIVKMEDKKIGY